MKIQLSSPNGVRLSFNLPGTLEKKTKFCEPDSLLALACDIHWVREVGRRKQKRIHDVMFEVHSAESRGWQQKTNILINGIHGNSWYKIEMAYSVVAVPQKCCLDGRGQTRREEISRKHRSHG